MCYNDSRGESVTGSEAGDFPSLRPSWSAEGDALETLLDVVTNGRPITINGYLIELIVEALHDVATEKAWIQNTKRTTRTTSKAKVDAVRRSGVDSSGGEPAER